MHLGASNDKAPTGLQVVDGVLIQVPCWHDSPDHLLLQGSAHVLQRYVFVVLHGDDDGMDAHGMTAPLSCVYCTVTWGRQGGRKCELLP